MQKICTSKAQHSRENHRRIALTIKEKTTLKLNWINLESLKQALYKKREMTKPLSCN